MLLYFFLINLVDYAFGYKPVVLVHGIMSEASHLLDMQRLITEHHPGTDVIPVKLYPEVESFVPLYRQLDYWKEKILPIMTANPNGIHLICHSQGGLICQGLIETLEDHNVHTFIALSSPIFGQFGIPAKILHYVPWMSGSRESLSKYMYTRFSQDTFAISNYWKDPRADYRQEYASYARYLPKLENDPLFPKLNKTVAAQQKKNFLKLKNLVLIGGPGDDVIKPWQSSFFGFFDTNMNIVPMRNQTMYIEDWFGLRAMDERGDVHEYEFPNVSHIRWHGNRNVFDNAIQQFID